jgi:hypothetical protein
VIERRELFPFIEKPAARVFHQGPEDIARADLAYQLAILNNGTPPLTALQHGLCNLYDTVGGLTGGQVHRHGIPYQRVLRVSLVVNGGENDPEAIQLRQNAYRAAVIVSYGEPRQLVFEDGLNGMHEIGIAVDSQRIATHAILDRRRLWHIRGTNRL